MMEYLTTQNALEAFEFFFWPAFWTTTYVCAVALAIDQLGKFFFRGTPAPRAAGPSRMKRMSGVLLMALGGLGLIACAAVWTALFGNPEQALALLIARIHGAEDDREVVVLAASTLSILLADIGSIVFLDAEEAQTLVQ
jgi:hypothetical protein